MQYRYDGLVSRALNSTNDNELFEVVTKMIHGSCRTINTNSPCMIDEKCFKQYPRDLLKDTITGNNNYNDKEVQTTMEMQLL